MASNTVAAFASELKMPADLLLKQLQAAGVKKPAVSSELTKADKDQLLDHLRKEHGGSTDGEKRKIVLTRNESSRPQQAASDLQLAR